MLVGRNVQVGQGGKVHCVRADSGLFLCGTYEICRENILSWIGGMDEITCNRCREKLDKYRSNLVMIHRIGADTRGFYEPPVHKNPYVGRLPRVGRRV